MNEALKNVLIFLKKSMKNFEANFVVECNKYFELLCKRQHDKV